jgi:hypothetical protein
MGARTVTQVTALTICNRPYARRFEGVETAVLAGRNIRSAADAREAWFASVVLVQTPYFFWVDDDDSLPLDYLDVLHDCLRAGAPIAYTDELVTGVRAGLRRSGAYSREAHLANPMMLHNLVLCRTDAALEVLHTLPVGHYWPEMLLFWALARGGAAYVPRVGYVWNRRADGLGSRPEASLSQMRSALWCKANP